MSSLKYLNFEVSEGKVPMLVRVVFETRVKNPPQQETKRKKRSERRRGVVAGMLSTLCGSMMCRLLGQRHPWDRDFLGGASWQEAAFSAGLSARGGGERTSWCHSVEWRGLLCSLSPCKVPCQRVLLQSRQAEGVRVSSRRLIAGHCLSSCSTQPHAGQAARLRHEPTALALPAPHAPRTYKAAAGRWRNSCNKKLESDIIIVHSQQRPGSCKLLNLSVSRCYQEILIIASCASTSLVSWPCKLPYCLPAQWALDFISMDEFCCPLQIWTETLQYLSALLLVQGHIFLLSLL